LGLLWKQEEIHMKKLFCACMAVLLGFSSNHVFSAPATRPSEEAATEPSARGLRSSELMAIRRISQHVLAAKKSGVEDGDDAAQLAALRAGVDQLIAAEVEAEDQSHITNQVKDAELPSGRKEKAISLRNTARSNLRAVTEQLRNRNAQRVALARRGAQDDKFSGGLPIGAQRARLFERLTQKLDAALADGSATRQGQLLALRDQLHGAQDSVGDAPLTHDTPTLQAMPWDFVPPKNSDTAKEQGK
jgi:hypothetical protein